MEISFVWEGEIPVNARNIEGSLQFALDHFANARVRDQVVKAYISLDSLKLNVTGVGWSKDDKDQLVNLNYDINRKASDCVLRKAES